MGAVSAHHAAGVMAELILQEDFLLIRGKRIHQVLAGRGESREVIRRFTHDLRAGFKRLLTAFCTEHGLAGFVASVRHIGHRFHPGVKHPLLGARDLEPFGDVLGNLVHISGIHFTLSPLRHHRARSEHRAACRAGVPRLRLTASRVGPGGGCRGENAG